MPEVRRKRRRRRLERKYMVRRVILLLMPVVLIVGVVLFLNMGPGAGRLEDGSVSRLPSEDGSEAETEATEETTEPETEPEPEPEPVPWNLLLVNSQNELPEGFEENLELDNLVGEFQVDRRIIEFYTEMSNAAKADGVDLMVCSAYRSVERQTELFEGYQEGYRNDGMTEEEALAQTLRLTARPGRSEHHTGLSVDIVTPEYQNLDDGYAETAAAKWLLENAAEYGFILRYPEGKESITMVDFEPWHYRYVGAEHAEIIMAEGYCLEEYFMTDLRGQVGGGDATEPEAGEDETTDEEPTDENAEPEESP